MRAFPTKSCAAPMHTLPETIAFASSPGVPVASIVVPVAGALLISQFGTGPLSLDAVRP